MRKQHEPIKLFIVDDHQLVIEGICSLLLDVPDITVVGTSTRPQQVPEELQRTGAEILLSDVQMPEMSGIELARIVRKTYPQIYVLALSMHSDIPVIKQMLDSGISGYILKNTGKSELIEAIRKVAAGQSHLSPEITREMMRVLHGRDNQDAHLTNREIEIIRLIEKEHANKQIAESLNISERTVETHRKNIFRKTGTQSIIGLLKYAYEHKII